MNWLRCGVFASFTAVAICLYAAAPTSHSGKYILYVGTYTEEGSQSKGIYAYNYDGNKQQITPVGLAAETTNPSWVAFHPNGRFLYAVNEVGNYKGQSGSATNGGLSAFAIDRATGKLTFLNEVATYGADPCYLIVDSTGKYVVVANYTGGNLVVFRIREDGSLGAASDVLLHSGHGTDPKRQRGPHVHSVDLSPDNRFAYVDDLGLNQLLVYKFDSVKGSLVGNVTRPVDFDPGAGPRHFALHPSGKFAYVISEMGSTVTAFSRNPDTGVLQSLQTISTLPKDFNGEKEAAEIEVHPSGEFLYASNRGDGNSIAVFAIDANKGALTPVEYMPTLGKTPRSFAVDPTGKLLFVANRASNNIVIFHIDVKTGHLKPTGKILDVPSPVCLNFLKVE